MADNGETKVKRADLIFGEGDAIESAYMLKSGHVSLFVERNGKKIEIQKIHSPHILGIEALLVDTKFTVSAEAINAVSFIKIPIEVLRSQLEKAPPGIKVLIKSQTEDLKTMKAAFRSKKLEEDTSPIPETFIPRVFGSISLTAKHLGLNLFELKKEEGKMETPFESSKKQDQKVSPYEGEESIKVSWSAMKLYTTRFFMASPKRIEFALKILTKMKLAEMIYVMNDENQQELKEIIIHQLGTLEAFADFYQYHLFRGARATLLKVDNRALEIATAFVSCSDESEADFRGLTTLKHSDVVNEVKKKFKFDFNMDHLNLLESKGLFARKQNKSGEISVSFDRIEFEKTTRFWSYIKEINGLNELGYVKITEDAVEEPNADTESNCPECESSIEGHQKFCSNCGHKVAA